MNMSFMYQSWSNSLEIMMNGINTVIECNEIKLMHCQIFGYNKQIISDSAMNQNYS